MNTHNTKKRFTRSRHHSRKGLTLLELIVVLTVLVALAGILLPTLPNLLTKSHVAVCSTNRPEMNKAVMTYAFLNTGAYPNQLDNLVDATDDASGLHGGGVFPANTLTVDTLSAGEVDSLAEIGITEIILADWDESPTFGAHAGTLTTVDNTVNVLLADDAHIEEIFNVAPVAGSTYVVFGVGMRSTLVGNQNGGIFEAPVHFSDDASANPTTTYARYVLIFRAFDDGEPAEFIGTSAVYDDGLENVNQHLEEFYL